MNHSLGVACAGFASFLASLATLPFLPLATAALVGVVIAALAVKYSKSTVSRQMPPWTPDMSIAITTTRV